MTIFMQVTSSLPVKKNYKRRCLKASDCFKFIYFSQQNTQNSLWIKSHWDAMDTHLQIIHLQDISRGCAAQSTAH